YSVKSCGGVRLARAELDRRGICNDRRWMVVRPDGQFITQREIPALARIQPEIADSQLILRRTGASDLSLPLAPPRDAPLFVRVWNDICEAWDCGPAAAAWLEDVLDVPCRLVKMDESFVRQVDASY